MSKKDYYDILGVTKKSAPEEINTGVAEEHSKTVTLILVKDEGVE